MKKYLISIFMVMFLLASAENKNAFAQDVDTSFTNSIDVDNRIVGNLAGRRRGRRALEEAERRAEAAELALAECNESLGEAERLAETVESELVDAGRRAETAELELAQCNEGRGDSDLQINDDLPDADSGFVGAVYAMSNKFDSNTIVGYGRNDDGTLTLVGEFETGGKGGFFDGGEGLDPLISAFSLILTQDRRFVLAVNAGDSTISALLINDDLSLTMTDTKPVPGAGLNSIAYNDGLVYVSIIDADGQFTAEPDQEGALIGFRLLPNGELLDIDDSERELGNRPSAIQFSPDGRYLIVSSINAGSAGLASGSEDELVVYKVNRRSGRLSESPVSAAASTLPGNDEGRNLPSAIGFEIVRDEGKDYVVVTEAREFQADGTPPAFPALQTGSVSTWELQQDGNLEPVMLDVLAGTDFFDGERTACWIEFSRDGNLFWVANALDSSISSYSFSQGNIELLDRSTVVGEPPVDGDPFSTTDGFIDLWISDDGEYLYQLLGLDGTINVYKIADDDKGSQLTLIQDVSDLPDVNTQGIVAF